MMNQLKSTKAETLSFLQGKNFNIPSGKYFSVQEWSENKDDVLADLLGFQSEFLVVRSSSRSEDTTTSSMAGAFCSLLNIRKNREDITQAVEIVIDSYRAYGLISDSDQVLVQEMIHDVVVSGVAMSKVLDDGSPYYVVNFDDSSGKTDTVTSGSSINKTVYIYNGAKSSDFDSAWLYKIVEMLKALEGIFVDIPLDTEFAIDAAQTLYLLQVRRICSTSNWDKRITNSVSEQIGYVSEYIERLMQPRHNLFGKKTILGVMPDWNPAEMIGLVPRPMASSLYNSLITENAWCTARRLMGYAQMPATCLMVMVSGHPYIDVRTSFNSLLPNGLVPGICEKLVNAWIDRLDANPHLHDKVEFEIVHTVLDFSFNQSFADRYNGLLTDSELAQYEGALRFLTIGALNKQPYSTLEYAESSLKRLEVLQRSPGETKGDVFVIADKINAMLSECVTYGTIPFAILARHAFIAESLLKSLVVRGAILEERVQEFKKSIYTITKEMSDDFYRVHKRELNQHDFMDKYGHLRPSTYDILSPCYRFRDSIFNGTPVKIEKYPDFTLDKLESHEINVLLNEAGFAGIEAQTLFDYAKISIRGREYGKFIFTKHLSNILECAAAWGELFGFSRDDMSFLPIEFITSITYTSLPKNAKNHIKDIIDKARDEYSLAQSFKLSYLIRSSRDAYVVPQQRTAPNFISRKSLEAPVKFLSPDMTTDIDLSGCIVCIEGADPGYDWIFSRNIAGLITKFGGANSHMAIRCAEYDLPAAIGCGEQTFERVLQANSCILNCAEKTLLPVYAGGVL